MHYYKPMLRENACRDTFEKYQRAFLSPLVYNVSYVEQLIKILGVDSKDTHNV
jgi:hypothetical protein